jgi:type IV pilus assembly protein PilV
MVKLDYSRIVTRQHGTSMIEVLVTIVILAIGLLGIAGLQTRLQTTEMDSYQRAQALILLNDMAARMTANHANALSYVTGYATPLGYGMTCPNSSSTTQQIDSAAWCNALQGASETAGMGGVSVGAMVGARGCIESLGSGAYMITVAWQGMTPLVAPPRSVRCGIDDYNGGSACVGDICRRVLTTTIQVGNLS